MTIVKEMLYINFVANKKKAFKTKVKITETKSQFKSRITHHSFRACDVCLTQSENLVWRKK